MISQTVFFKNPVYGTVYGHWRLGLKMCLKKKMKKKHGLWDRGMFTGGPIKNLIEKSWPGLLDSDMVTGSLKEPFWGHHFPTLTDLNLAMTRRIRELNSNGLPDDIKKLPNRWKCVIVAMGDYIKRRNVKIDLNE